MAYIEIEPDPFESKEIFKFAAIGDRLVGTYVSKAEGKYGLDYTFKCADGKERLVTPNGPLLNQLKKAEAQGFKPGCKTLIQFKSNRDIGKESPLKEFRVAFEPAGSAPPPPPPKPASDADPF